MTAIKRIIRSLICATTDWLGLVDYRPDASLLRRSLGAAAQMTWFRAHNNRLYRWADS